MMKRHFAAVVMVVACHFYTGALSVAHAEAAAQPASIRGAYSHTDRLIVRFKEGANGGVANILATSSAFQAADKIAGAAGSVAARAALENQSAQRTKVVDRLQLLVAEPLAPFRTMGDGSHVIKLNRRLSIEEVKAIAARLANDPEILEVIPDRLAFPALAPNDTQYVDQWNLSQLEGINVPAAWDITTGLASQVIAIVDTGILNHAELSGRFLAGYDFVGDLNRSNDGTARDASAVDPGDWVTSSENLSGALAGCGIGDSTWHGTAMAGAIGAIANNGAGIAGINWNAKILPVRAVGKCGGYTSDIADGIRWAAGLPFVGIPDNANPAKVINLSLAASSLCAISSCVTL